jgi:lipopolysaccharide biosynthesis glycosyltransferase
LSPKIDKILYLDSDIIVRRSLTELWNTDITNRALAAASTPYEDDARRALGLAAGIECFNSGVMLINLEFWRRNDVPDKAISFARNNPEAVQYWDQDALNAVLVHQWIDIPSCWNWREWRRGPTSDSGVEPAIVHFFTADKPWHWSNTHPFKSEYHEYRRRTPWRRYRQEGQPGPVRRFGRLLRSFVRFVLPHRVRQWLRSRVMSSEV